MALQVNRYSSFGQQDGVGTLGASGHTFSTSVFRSGICSLNLGNAGGNFYRPRWVPLNQVATITDQGGHHIITVVWRLSTANTGTTGSLFGPEDDADAVLMQVVLVNDGGTLKLELRDKSNVKIGSLRTGEILPNTWYTTIIRAQLNNASGDWKWWHGVSGTVLPEIESGSGADFNQGGSFGSSASMLTLTGITGAGDTYYDCILIQSGSTSDDDRFDDLKVQFYYNTATTGATPAAGLNGASGTALHASSTWAMAAAFPMTIGAGNRAIYEPETTDPSQGTVDLNGPSGDTTIYGDSNIKAIQGVWYGGRLTGTPSTHQVGLGDSGDGNSAALATVTLNVANDLWLWVRETDLPTTTQNVRQGIRVTGGARDWALNANFAELLIEPPLLSGVYLSMAPYTQTMR